MKIRILVFTTIILMGLLVAPASASILDDVVNWIKDLIQPFVWFMPAGYIKVTDTAIEFYVGISGESWRVDLRDINQNLVAQKSGYSYGYHSFSRPPAGTYYLSIWCFYGSSTCTSNNVETVIVPEIMIPTTVSLSPSVSTLKIGNTLNIEAVVRNQRGEVMNINPTWSSNNPSIISISKDTSTLPASISSISLLPTIPNPTISYSSEVRTSGPPSLLDSIRNSVSSLSWTVSCLSGYVYCYEQNNIYGNAQAIARVYVTDPYVSGGNLYIGYRGDGLKYYKYRGITSWSQVVCDVNGCNGEAIGSNEVALLGSSPSTSQQGVVYVVWDYSTYEDYWTWTWVGFGWLGPFNYDLSSQLPTPTPTSTPTSTIIDSNKITVTSLKTGNVIIKASFMETYGLSSLSIVEGGLATITISPLTNNAEIGSNTALIAEFKDQFGTIITVTPTWSSSNSLVASVSSLGVVTGISKGTTVITATYNEVSGSSIFTIIDSTETQITDPEIITSVTIVRLGEVFSPTISTPFTVTNDLNCDDGSCTYIYGTWGVLDSNKNILWSATFKEISTSPYTVNIPNIPFITIGKYFVVGTVVSSVYTYTSNGWVKDEQIVGKSVMDVDVTAPGVVINPPNAIAAFIAAIWAFLRTLFPFLPANM